MNLEKFIDDVISQNQDAFLQALDGKLNVKNKTKNKVNFTAEILKKIAQIELRNRCLFYLNYYQDNFIKNQIPLENKSFISTIHPIGNLSIKHGIIIDKISRINLVKIRFFLLHKKVKKSKILESILKNLAKKFVNLAIDIKVISNKRQSEASLLKIDYLGRFLIVKNSCKNWDKVDADGDPKNSISLVLGKKIRGKNFLEIYLNHNKIKDNQSTILEPRISCDYKKGVDGVRIFLEKIFTKNSKITSIKNLFNEDIFSLEYKKIEQILLTKKYNNINSIIDFILRINLPNFIKSDGLILSDFPGDEGKEILIKLLFIKKACDVFLSRNLEKNFTIYKQKFLPLCEKEKDINNLTKVIQDILVQIVDLAKEIADDKSKNKEQKIIKLQELKSLFSADNKLVFGAFFGPSDLTANMGGISIALINNKLLKLLEIYHNFQSQIRKIISFDDIEFLIEYGKGSSPVRGANYVIPALQTIQGQALVSADHFINKIYNIAKSNPIKNIFIGLDIVEKSIKNHRYFLNNKNPLGLIAQEYDKLFLQQDSAKMLFVTTKNFSNNQGTRGKSGLIKFEDQRAIGLATFRSFFGLLIAPFLPYDSLSKPQIKWPKDEFLQFINHPAGFSILLVEIYQLLTIDFMRAKSIGFSRDLISEIILYVSAAQRFLAEIFELENNDKSEVFLTKLTAKLTDKNFIHSQNLRKRAQLFLQQIPLLIDLRNEITANLVSLKNKIDLEGNNINKIMADGTAIELNYDRNLEYATIATYLNLLTNFQLPIISDYEYQF